MKYVKRTSLLFPALAWFFIVSGQILAENIPNPNAVATYECASVYWKTPENGACKIRYKELKSSSWKDGLDLVYDPRDNEYRGSIITLAPNTEYQV